MQATAKKTGQEVFVEDILKKITENIELKKRLVADNQYIEWLYNFTKRHSCFSDTRWDYEDPRTISDEDYEKVNMLDKFFGAIEDYYSKNLLPANGVGLHERWYTIKYKDVYFDIGVCIGQGAYNYVERYEDKPERYIEFEKIVADETHEQVEIKKEKLLRLEQILEEIKELDIPYSVVMDRLNKIIG